MKSWSANDGASAAGLGPQASKPSERIQRSKNSWPWLIEINGRELASWHLVMPPESANLNFHKYTGCKSMLINTTRSLFTLALIPGHSAASCHAGCQMPLPVWVKSRHISSNFYTKQSASKSRFTPTNWTTWPRVVNRIKASSPLQIVFSQHVKGISKAFSLQAAWFGPIQEIHIAYNRRRVSAKLCNLSECHYSVLHRTNFYLLSIGWREQNSSEPVRIPFLYKSFTPWSDFNSTYLALMLLRSGSGRPNSMQWPPFSDDHNGRVRER